MSTFRKSIEHKTERWRYEGRIAEWTITRAGRAIYVVRSRGTGALAKVKPGAMPPYLRRAGSYRTLAEAKAKVLRDEAIGAQMLADAAIEEIA